MQRSGRPTHDIFVLKTKIFWYVVTLQCHYVCSDLNCINEIEIVEILDKKTQVSVFIRCFLKVLIFGCIFGYPIFGIWIFDGKNLLGTRPAKFSV